MKFRWIFTIIIIYIIVLYIIFKIYIYPNFQWFDSTGKFLLTTIYLIFSLLILLYIYGVYFNKNKFISNLNIFISLLTLITMVILTIGIYIEQIPKPVLFVETYYENNSFFVTFINIGNVPVLLTNFSIINKTNDTLLTIVESPKKPIESISTYNLEQKLNNFSVYYCYLWKRKEECKQTEFINFERLPTVEFTQKINIGTSVTITINRTNGSIEKYESVS